MQGFWRSSQTWWRVNMGSFSARSSGSDAWHASQISGRWMTTSSTASIGTNLRVVPSCPGCPPRFLPVGSLRGLAGAPGGSEDGGLWEFLESWFKRSSSLAMRTSRSAILRSRAAQPGQFANPGSRLSTSFMPEISAQGPWELYGNGRENHPVSPSQPLTATAAERLQQCSTENDSRAAGRNARGH